jgi:hypothetical protein
LSLKRYPTIQIARDAGELNAKTPAPPLMPKLVRLRLGAFKMQHKRSIGSGDSNNGPKVTDDIHRRNGMLFGGVSDLQAVSSIRITPGDQMICGGHSGW